jgi:hypothetical protein
MLSSLSRRHHPQISSLFSAASITATRFHSVASPAWFETGLQRHLKDDADRKIPTNMLVQVLSEARSKTLCARAADVVSDLANENDPYFEKHFANAETASVLLKAMNRDGTTLSYKDSIINAAFYCANRSAAVRSRFSQSDAIETILKTSTACSVQDDVLSLIDNLTEGHPPVTKRFVASDHFAPAIEKLCALVKNDDDSSTHDKFCTILLRFFKTDRKTMLSKFGTKEFRKKLNKLRDVNASEYDEVIKIVENHLARQKREEKKKQRQAQKEQEEKETAQQQEKSPETPETPQEPKSPEKKDGQAISSIQKSVDDIRELISKLAQRLDDAEKK